MKVAALTILAMVASPGSGYADDASPEAANRALATALESAWNAHDMEVAFRSLLTKDVDWVNVNAGHGKGIDPVVQGHARVHAGKFKDSVMTVKSADVAVLKPDVALVYVSWEMRGDRNDDGTPREPREGFRFVDARTGRLDVMNYVIGTAVLDLSSGSQCNTSVGRT